ncbi:uncharacterized protein F4807DRAFT_463335 [Annulohypoxylon truncatum]|uniref:uncharacterized protein n=1 Tax=Annulohypoxylon truncatum TaxID=327061 RepID=UPI00200853E1|nr:uncharacterized protein F4807DRAFT_463335 [Annulohypoxylon truncatum]KAI1206934.1 hypothetical protein F4807DRAFT_463335 [Annulohypoxylon truncatum]
METADYNQITALVVISTVLTIITAILMIIRIWARFFVLKIASLDDYMAIASLIFTIGYLALLYLDKNNGLGHPIGTLSDEDMETQLKSKDRLSH